MLNLKDDPNVNYEETMAEQGFLNVVYKNKWYEFGFGNNANLAVYSHQKNYWKENEKSINVIHYTMNKPWSCSTTYKPVCHIWQNF